MGIIRQVTHHCSRNSLWVLDSHEVLEVQEVQVFQLIPERESRINRLRHLSLLLFLYNTWHAPLRDNICK